MILQAECYPVINKTVKTMNSSQQKPIAPKFVPTTLHEQEHIGQIPTSSPSPLMMASAESTVSSTVQAGHQIRGGGNSSGGGARRKIAFMHPTLGYPIAAPLPAKVARRNARERNRVKQVNCGFEVLRNHIPSAAKQKKMSKVDTLRHAVDYIEKLQHILTEQRIDVNVSTCVRTNEKSSYAEDTTSCNSSSSMPAETTRLSSQNKQMKNNNRNKNSRNRGENKSIAPKCAASRPNLPPPLIMLPKSNHQTMHPSYHNQPHHHHLQQTSPTTPSSSSGCSSPAINSPLLGPNNQPIMNNSQGHFNHISPNQQNYPPPLTPRTPSNSSGNTDHFCQFVDGSPSPSGVVIASSSVTNESGYDSITSSFYHSPTSPNQQQQQHQLPTHMMQSPSPMRQIAEHPSPMGYHNYPQQQGYQVPCTPPASSIHSHASLYSTGQQPNRANAACEPVQDMDEGFHLGNQNHHTNTARFDFQYDTHSPEEDELLDVIAKWQEA